MYIIILYSVIISRPSSFVYFPFGLGHRSCIGKHFAMVTPYLLIFTLVVCLARHCTCTQQNGYELSVIVENTFRLTMLWNVDLMNNIMYA